MQKDHGALKGVQVKQNEDQYMSESPKKVHLSIFFHHLCSSFQFPSSPYSYSPIVRNIRDQNDDIFSKSGITDANKRRFSSVSRPFPIQKTLP